MEHLWSPWRSQYIETFSNTTPKTSECFLCDAFYQPQRDAELLVVARRERCFVIMNRFPYNSGHIMVVPNRHCGELRLLSDDELMLLFRTVREAEDVLHKVFKPHGINVGLNLGSAAGAGVPSHLHVHLVPRWNGDVNFMPVLADIKIVSERLEDTYQKLTQGFEASAAA